MTSAERPETGTKHPETGAEHIETGTKHPETVAERDNRSTAAPDPLRDSAIGVRRRDGVARGSGRVRVWIAVVAAALLAVVAVGYVRVAAHRSGGDPGAARTMSLRAPGTVLVRSTVDGPGYGRLAVAGDGGRGGRTVGSAECVRVYAAAGTGVCLRPSTRDVGGYELAVLDDQARPTRSIPLNGIPSRARVSASGRMVSWTTFVTGDSYSGAGGFSTRSGILDTRANVLAGSLETFAVTLDGHPYAGSDANFWGVTFTPDDNHFYATMSVQGHRYLVAGDFAARTVRTVYDNVECPSLSPDSTRIVYKKRVSDDPAHLWRLTVLDLRSWTETALAESANVDDQAAWLDDHTIAYGRPADSRHANVWTVHADGSGAPHILVADAESPAPLG